MQGSNKPLLIDARFAGKLFSTGFLQLRPLDGVLDAQYLRHFVASQDFLSQRDALATGSTQIALTDAGARQLTIPIAPLNE